VIVQRDTTNAERAFLLAHDTDPFNRWEAGRTLALATLKDMIRTDAGPDAAYLDGMLSVLRDDALDPAYRALMLAQPGQSELAAALAQDGAVPDPTAIWQASETLKQALARNAQDVLPRILSDCQVDGPYRPDPDQTGKRALSGAALSLLTRLDGGVQASLQYSVADNMTLQLSALACLLSAQKGEDQTEAFYQQWKADRLVIDKWFGLQAMQAAPDKAVQVTADLTRHTDFNWKNPNRFRATLGALSMNHAGFHAADGSGYALLADWLIRLDPVNPQTTARMCSAFQTWRRYDESRQALIGAQLDRIIATPGLSRDTTEMITRIQGAR
jgi:aminopeptidase N